MRNIWVMMTILLLASSCREDKHPKDIVEREIFEAIYIELMDSASTPQNDSLKLPITPVAARILDRHQVTIEQLKATVDYYNADSKRWKPFYEGVVKKVNERSLKNTTQ